MSALPLLPGETIGVLGGGQLGRMFALEAIRMGYTVWVFDADESSPAGRIAHKHIRASYDDPEALSEFADGCSAVTTEFENVPATALERLAENCRVAPAASALSVAQDRVQEKTLFASCGIPTVRWAPLESASEVSTAWTHVGRAGILKTARLGYDGKGQVLCSDQAALAAGFEQLGGVPCVFEERVDLATEVSVVVARAADGQVVSLPVGENCHRNGILHTTRVPARVDSSVLQAARQTAAETVAALDYCGVLAVEFFVTRSGELLANEIAPRPHNSGHFSQLGCAVNQFELQVRTLCSLPLVEPVLRQPTAMLNILGDLWQGGEPAWQTVLEQADTELHLYGKEVARAGRKMGHINVTAASDAALDALLSTTSQKLGLTP